MTALAKDGKSFGKPALTYIEECEMERRLGKSLTTESNAKPLSWGKLLENRAFEILGIEYQLISQESIVHPDFNYWAGSTDGLKFDEGKTDIDIKCPITLKSFCGLVDPLYNGLQGIEAFNAIRNGFTDSKGKFHSAHKDGEKYYWQLVSNAILNNCKYAELIVYVPYQSELMEIRSLAKDDKAYSWITWAEDNELPSLVNDGYYKNLNIIRFEVPQEDKERLIDCVKRAGGLLNG